MIYRLPENKHLALKAIESAKDGYYCEISKRKVKRSNNQNRYYWKIIVEMFSQEIGQIPNEIHQDLTKHFLSYKSNGKDYVRSTTELSTVEFETYLESCRRLGSIHYGMYIPLPNECTEDLYKELDNYRIN